MGWANEMMLPKRVASVGRVVLPRVPHDTLTVVLALCAAPSLARACGGNWASRGEVDARALHVLVEWTGVIAASTTGAVALLHARKLRRALPAVLGVALLSAAAIDTAHTFAAAGLVAHTADHDHLIVLTWALSRTFHAGLLVGGLAFAISSSSRRALPRWVAVGVASAVAAAIVVVIRVEAFPEVSFPEAMVPRPWDLPPLVLLVAAASMLLIVRRHAPGLFTEALLLSVLPQIAAQLHMALGSREVGDHAFHAAHILKVLAYVIVMAGLALEHLRRHRDESVSVADVERDSCRFGQYELVRKIGEGGMGTVYEGRHALLRRRSAIKILPPDRDRPGWLARFEREARLTAELEHPNVVAVYDYGFSASGVFYYAMEMLDGIDLERLVRCHGAQSPRRVAHILHQVAGALAEAHERGLVHRDMKPANVMLCRRGNELDVAKVLDFGLVKDLFSAGPSATDHGVFAGTPLYMSPEAIASPARVGAPTDVYALGAVGYFLLTGRRLFDGPSAVDVCHQHLYATPIPPDVTSSGLEEAVVATIMRCLAKAPIDRPTAAELERELGLMQHDQPWTQDDARRSWRPGSAAPRTDGVSVSAPTLAANAERFGRVA